MAAARRCGQTSRTCQTPTTPSATPAPCPDSRTRVRRRSRRRDPDDQQEGVAHSTGNSLTIPTSAVQAHCPENQRLQVGLRQRPTLTEVDGSDALAVQTRVEEPLRVLQLGTLRERQPYGVLEHLADAHDAVERPHRHSLWP